MPQPIDKLIIPIILEKLEKLMTYYFTSFRMSNCS